MGIGRSPFSAPVHLDPSHDVQMFDCGNETLNDWFRIQALSNQINDATRTFVVLDLNGTVAGFYSLAAGAMDREEAPGSLRRNMPDPIPIIVLARLAVSLKYQSAGLGTGLLKDASRRSFEVSRLAGVRALIVHASSTDVIGFYERFGFKPVPTRSSLLYLQMSAIARSLDLQR